MLECKYVNSQFKTFVFNIDNNRINKSDIRDYEWQYTEQYNKIKTFNTSLKTRSIPVTFFNRFGYRNRNEMYTKAQDLYAMTDYDVRSLQMGKLYIGDYYINCYIVGSSKQKYDNGVVIAETLTVLSDFMWHKEIERIFGPNIYTPSIEDSDFPYDYPWDYILAGTKRFTTGSIAPFDFKIVFSGPIYPNAEVTVMAGGNAHTYRVYTSVNSGEYLTVDSREKKIYLTKTNGEVVNKYNDRDRENYIFQKMPIENGTSSIVLNEAYLVTITAYVERSEPLWI